MSEENQNPNTPIKRRHPVMTEKGQIARNCENGNSFESPEPGQKRSNNDAFETPISNIDPSDKEVQNSKRRQQTGSPPQSPLAVGQMPGNIMTPNAHIPL